MKTNRTEKTVIEGIEYEVSDLLTELNVSNPICGADAMVNVNMRLRPYVTIDGVKTLATDLDDRPVRITDLANCGDADALLCFQKIQEALQEYILKKNI